MWKGALWVNMKMSKTNWYRRFLLATKGLFYENPILSMGLALPFAAVACTSLQTAVGLSIGALIALIPAVLLMFVIYKKLPEQFLWLEYPLCALLSAVFVLPTRLVVGSISPALMDSVGVYFSLFCVSSLLFCAAEKSKKETDPARVLLDLVRMWLGVVIVLLLVGLIREILGYGTIWNKPLTFMKIRFSGVMVAGLGFILLGFLSALGKKLHRVILLLQFRIGEKWPLFREKVAHLFEKEAKAVKAAAQEGAVPSEPEAKEESPEELVEQITDAVMGKEQDK